MSDDEENGGVFQGRYENDWYIDDVISREIIDVDNDELGLNNNVREESNEHDECTDDEVICGVIGGGTQLEDMIDNGYLPDDECSSNTDSGEDYGEELLDWRGRVEEEESGPTGQVTGTATGYRDSSVGTIVFNKTSLPQNKY